jgi:hypothetical protein
MHTFQEQTEIDSDDCANVGQMTDHFQIGIVGTGD